MSSEELAPKITGMIIGIKSEESLLETVSSIELLREKVKEGSELLG
jgi:hypothetical protein